MSSKVQLAPEGQSCRYDGGSNPAQGGPESEFLSAEAPEDLDPAETQEWLESLEAIIQHAGPALAAHILKRLLRLT